ncbi:MAG: alpha/beta hydrolase [Myxococcota bacterium]
MNAQAELPTELFVPERKPLALLRGFGVAATLPAVWPRIADRRGHANVVVVPGFMTGDSVTFVLRRTLARLGHRVDGWGLGLNLGRVESVLPRVAGLVRRRARQGRVDIIGWSLGGFMAREVAREAPALVRQVITMGSPIVGGPKYTTTHRFFRERRGLDLDVLEQELLLRDRRPIEVPITALFSRSDGVVCPAACIDRVSPKVEHVEVQCAHTGFGFSPEVYEVITERLLRS